MTELLVAISLGGFLLVIAVLCVNAASIILITWRRGDRMTAILKSTLAWTVALTLAAFSLR